MAVLALFSRYYLQEELQLLERVGERLELRGVTVLTVAHRLHTVVFYEKVMLLAEGGVLEYDAPATLLDEMCPVSLCGGV